MSESKSHTCKYCESTFSTKQSFNLHTKTSKYCLDKRKLYVGFTCNGCQSKYSTIGSLKRHMKSGACERKRNQEMVMISKEEYKELISPPSNDIKVFKKIIETMMMGKIDLSNIHKELEEENKELQKENEERGLRIKYLEKKYIKKQPRIEYKESNVIYILTTELLKKERRYILGKATNLTNRLSTYNKTDEHKVIYYQRCKDKSTMDMVESLVFIKLEKYREQANRERFILPEGENIEMFIEIIKGCIDFLK